VIDHRLRRSQGRNTERRRSSGIASERERSGKGPILEGSNSTIKTAGVSAIRNLINESAKMAAEGHATDP
jgi:hypothetical protein